MKLIRKECHCICEIQKDLVIFYSRIFEKKMKKLGISIPHGQRGVYGGKDVIYLGEKEFCKAFKEIYYPTYMNHKNYHWVD